MAAATAGFLATDKAVPPALTKDPSSLNRYVKISDYGLYSLIGAGGGLFLWSKISHDDHQRETGILAAEAAINGYATDTALKYAFGRERPYLGQGQGDFFDHGDSFPSDHSVLAWSIASVIAHEYPGPFTQVAVYGLAAAVSASRVMGEQHFPSDVVVGAADRLAHWPAGLSRASRSGTSGAVAGASYPEATTKSGAIGSTWVLHL